ncbi:hypothetical protein HUJ04_000538 [Dendroctonus ponderosae]|nr:hypothetical protein HUJ04_000538 [Dendroctonus ponderosae]
MAGRIEYMSVFDSDEDDMFDNMLTVTPRRPKVFKKRPNYFIEYTDLEFLLGFECKSKPTWALVCWQQYASVRGLLVLNTHRIRMSSIKIPPALFMRKQKNSVACTLGREGRGDLAYCNALFMSGVYIDFWNYGVGPMAPRLTGGGKVDSGGNWIISMKLMTTKESSRDETIDAILYTIYY